MFPVRMTDCPWVFQGWHFRVDHKLGPVHTNALSFENRLLVVPHFSSGIVERAKRERTFARSAIPEEKWGTTRSLFSNESALVCTGPNLWSTRKRHPWKTQGQPVILKENMFSFATNPVHTIPCIARIHDAGGKT